jgi:hypothetical protein
VTPPLTRTTRCALLALLALSAPGCQRARLDPDAHAARVAVDRYADALVLAYRAASVEPLRGVAAPEEIARVGEVIRRLREQGKVMEARRTELTVRHVEVIRRARAVTLVDVVEAWEYEHRDAASPSTPAPIRRERYHLVYELLRSDLTFVVRAVTEHVLPPGEGSPGR